MRFRHGLFLGLVIGLMAVCIQHRMFMRAIPRIEDVSFGYGVSWGEIPERIDAGCDLLIYTDDYASHAKYFQPGALEIFTKYMKEECKVNDDSHNGSYITVEPNPPYSTH